MPKAASEETKLEWKIRIEQQRQSGLSINSWCRQQQIESHTFSYWKSKLFPKPLERSSFTELNVRRSSTVVLQARGIYARIGKDCDPYFRKQLFSLFAEVSC